MNIKQVSEKHGITSDTLRYWERVGVIPPIHRNSSGYRDYDEEDLDWVHYAKCMRDAGVSVEALAEYITLFGQGDDTIPARKSLLLEQQAVIKVRMNEITKLYDKISEKIDNYESHVLSYEGKLKIKG